MKLRVIGGRLKGKPLATPKGLDVRPTAGRVREAIFNILFSRVQNAVVLDLFAGTGAFGIEALSRGASQAVFIDNSPASLAVLKKNIQACGLEAVAEIRRYDAARQLFGLTEFKLAFDIVFMDPPYNRNAVDAALTGLVQADLLKQGALVVAEHALTESVTGADRAFFLKDQRKYGRTLVSFLEFMID